MIFAYFGPETFLPLTSIIAGIVGVFLAFGKSIGYLALGLVRMVKQTLGLGTAKKSDSPFDPPSPDGAIPAPHVMANSGRARYLGRERAKARVNGEEPLEAQAQTAEAHHD